MKAVSGSIPPPRPHLLMYRSMTLCDCRKASWQLSMHLARAWLRCTVGRSPSCLATRRACSTRLATRFLTAPGEVEGLREAERAQLSPGSLTVPAGWEEGGAGQGA